MYTIRRLENTLRLPQTTLLNSNKKFQADQADQPTETFENLNE